MILFTPRIHADPALHIRTATEPFEISQLRAVFDHEHYLKAGRPAGHVLWQGVYRQEPEDGSNQLVAVLCWAGTAKRLKDRHPLARRSQLPPQALGGKNPCHTSGSHLGTHPAGEVHLAQRPIRQLHRAEALRLLTQTAPQCPCLRGIENAVAFGKAVS